jgi:hypothetical protein
MEPAVKPHSPLIMGEVPKLANWDRAKMLTGSELGEFDSVKKVSMLIDGLGK